MSLNGDKSKKVLIVGIGNPLRSDDGVGPYVADCIEAKGLDGVTVWVTQQLNMEDLERMLGFARVILVDASLNGVGVDLHPVQKPSGQLMASSHHMSAEVFVSLAESIYHQDLPMHLCSIKGNSFDVGNKISPEVLDRAQQAVDLICSNIMLPLKG